MPSDNPFAEKRDRAEIFALGIRNAMGLFVHPQTGEIWETENGPMGGDEINIIKPGRNYGWPVVSYGTDYSGNQKGGLSGTSSDDRMKPGMEDPFIFWNPSPAVTGIVVYTGDRFPQWKGNIFVGAMGGGESRDPANCTGSSYNRDGRTTRQPDDVGGAQERIRDVKQGPDGLLYLTTVEAAGSGCCGLNLWKERHDNRHSRV